MSRPPTMRNPYEQQNMNPNGGGLIDFHQNIIRADIAPALYGAAQGYVDPTYLYQQQQQALMYPMPQPSPACLAAPAIAPSPPITAAPCPAQLASMYQHLAPQPMQVPAPTQPAAAPPAMQGIVAGNPSYLHFNGQKYAPITEESGAKVSRAESLKPEIDSRVMDKHSDDPDRRVSRKIAEFLNATAAKDAPRVRANSRKSRQSETASVCKQLAQLNKEMYSIM